VADAIGAMRERLTVQQNVWPDVAISSLSQAAGLATAVTGVAHGYATHDYVTIAGALPAGYNGKVKITVVDTVTFTYTASAGLSSPATQSPTATYASDAQGGRRSHWSTLATIFAEMTPMQSQERLQINAVQANEAYTFRVRVRPDLSPKMRVQWTPRWPAFATARQLEIASVDPDMGGGATAFLLLQCVGVSQ
jgi:SPP1 family predicted phage head-tail adaptor